ncbi:MAG: hypothetical protein AW07_01596 [Candidatus Accumulibacter sp. SK-11]|nr:MAG: hypothetical protein AW07_01596 [Candidatus Accumulibacter sp. SK-11]
MVDRLLPHAQALDGEYREARLLVVVAGMVAVRPLERGLLRVDEALENDLGRGRHLQIRTETFHHFGLAAAQQAGELVLGQAVGDRRHRCEDRRRVGPEGDGERERLAWMLQAMLAEVERATTMRQPAHDQLVRPQHLLAVDAEVLTRLVRPARHRQAPGDQRRHIARPAPLDRQAPQIDIAALADDLLTRRRGTQAWRHVEHLPQHRQLVPGVPEPPRRFRLLEIGEQLAHFAQRQHRLLSHSQRHPPRRTEEVGQHRHVMAGRLLEEQRRPTGTQHAIADLGDLETGVDGHSDPPEFAHLLKLRNEVAQVVILHRQQVRPSSSARL